MYPEIDDAGYKPGVICCIVIARRESKCHIFSIKKYSDETAAHYGQLNEYKKVAAFSEFSIVLSSFSR